MPRKVTVYISAPPGDGLEKSRNWFREYVKPVLVAGAVDYEVKESKTPGQIETSVIEEVVKRRRETAASYSASEDFENNSTPEQTNNTKNFLATPFIDDKQKGAEIVTDGILAVGRNAYREVLSGLSKGCDASLIVVEEVPVVEATSITEESTSDNHSNEESVNTEKVEIETTSSEPTEVIMEPVQEEQIDHFSLPDKFSPVTYIPHVNIIGWSNIPYRLYMWYADYQRIEDIGNYVVAAVLNETRPMEKSDADLGQNEKKYWLGDEKVELLKENDEPIVIDERIIDKLSTYVSEGTR
ncbi:unnamed protein product [Mucor hiemalis]